METQDARRAGNRSRINIDVTLDRTLSKSSCIEIVEDLLKYILYQRRQIPVQFEALTKEVAMADSSPPQIREEKVYSRKEEIARLKLDRQRQRWLRKVQSVIEDFRIVMQRLRTEFEKGGVVAVNLILGCSVLSSREVFSINLPHNYSLASESQGLNSRRHNAMQFFRTLITNEDLLKLVSRPSSIQKVWVILQKMHSISTPSTFGSSQTQESAPAPGASPGLVPRLGYSPNLGARVVQINVCHPAPLLTPMALTPTVGFGIVWCSNASCRKMATKRSLGFNVSSMPKRYSCDGNSQCRNDFSEGRVTSDRRETVCLEIFDGIKRLDSVCHESPSNQRLTQKRECIETPLDHSKGIAPVIDAPVTPSFNQKNHLTPSKLLSSQLGNFTLSDDCPNDISCSTGALWYQIDHAICGFKGFYLQQ